MHVFFQTQFHKPSPFHHGSFWVRGIFTPGRHERPRPTLMWCCAGQLRWKVPSNWVNYNDLTATSVESWLIREIIPKWP